MLNSRLQEVKINPEDYSLGHQTGPSARFMIVLFSFR